MNAGEVVLVASSEEEKKMDTTDTSVWFRAVVFIFSVRGTSARELTGRSR